VVRRERPSKRKIFRTAILLFQKRVSQTISQCLGGQLENVPGYDNVGIPKLKVKEENDKWLKGKIIWVSINTMSYREGIIYNLFSPNTNRCYIGCTTKDLNTTFTSLRAYCKKKRNVSSNEIIEAGSPQIEVLETFQDITIPELRKELGKIQEKYADACINRHRAGRTVKDRYHLDSTKFIERQRKFYAKHKEEILRKMTLVNMRKRGLPCTDRVRQRYNITQAEIDDCVTRRETT
jgi:hypothetical protein